MIYKDKLLTIAIPTYNGSKTIEDALSILIPQCDNRVELIISDNASTDNTKDVVSNFLNGFKDPIEIIYVRNETNIGPDSNYLQCLNMAKGMYTLLLSDDDILIENSLGSVLSFLENNEDLSLVYLNAVGFREKYKGLDKCHKFDESIYDNKCIVTTDKRLFMKYSGRMWGFLSCFIVKTEAFKTINSVEEYLNTNWIQSYIHVLCSNYGEKKLGIISKPIIGAGIYSFIFNYDSGEVNGKKYKRLIDYSIENGFDNRQMQRVYIWHVCFLSKRALIKERAAGVHKTTTKNLFTSTWKYPYAWIHLYPYFFLPPFLCKFINYLNNRIKGYKNKGVINRLGDVDVK